ncbi:hypothetical protein EGW08_001090, partial [Elysia chlorotica]
TNVKPSKPLRPLSADYAISISNINEIPNPSGDCASNKPKAFEKQRPYSICSDRDVVKNSPLRIIMTNQAFQQHSSSDSDSDTEVKLATFSFANPASVDYSQKYKIVLDTNSLRDSCSKNNDQPSLADKINKDKNDSEGSSEIAFQCTTKTDSTSNPASLCTSSPLIPSSSSSMQACAGNQFNAAQTKSSNENMQQVQNQSSNVSGSVDLLPCQDKQSTSTSQCHHPGETRSMFSPRHPALRRSKSELNLSTKPASTSAFDAFFGSVWDSGKMLERSASVCELDLLSKRAGSLFDLDDVDGSCEGWDQPASEFDANPMPPWLLANSYSTSNGSSLPDQAFSIEGAAHHHGNTEHQPDSACTSGSTDGRPQFHPRRYHVPHKQHRGHHRRQAGHNFQYPHAVHLQPLRLDLSDVTEIDEEGSERGETASSFRGSLDMSGRLTDEDGSSSKLTSDESPRLDVDGQTTRFNSQFYSLCKVDSNRSLQSSVNNSREKLSLTSLTDGCEVDDARELHCNTNTKCRSPCEGEPQCCVHHCRGENEIAAREFDEISRQIASLSRTVDELTHSLSSLASSEFEPDAVSAAIPHATGHLDDDDLLRSATTARLASSLPTLTSTRSDIIDGYHWVNDEFFLMSGNGEVMAGGRRHENVEHEAGGEDDSDSLSSDAFVYPQDCNGSSDQIATEDAREEFLLISAVSTKSSGEIINSSGLPISENWTLAKACSGWQGGQDNIFARSNFDTVRENISLSDKAVKSNMKEHK